MGQEDGPSKAFLSAAVCKMFWVLHPDGDAKPSRPLRLEVL